MVKEFEDVIKGVREENEKSKEGNDIQVWLSKFDKIVEKMKESVKPQLTLKDTDMELIGKMALA